MDDRKNPFTVFSIKGESLPTALRGLAEQIEQKYPALAEGADVNLLHTVVTADTLFDSVRMSQVVSLVAMVPTPFV